MQSLLLLLPDFSLILLGAVLRRHLVDGEAFWTGVEKLVYFVLFPALLFNALATADIDPGRALPLFLAGLGTMVAGFLLGLIGRSLMGLDAMGFASRLQCAYRFNTYIGIAIAGKLHGAAGIALMGGLCGAMVPFANVMAVGMLARHGQGSLLRELSRNPLVLATLAGLLFNLAGLELPGPLTSFLKRLGDAAVALGLLAVGAALRWEMVSGRWSGSAWIIAVKLLFLPAVAWQIGRALGVEGVAFAMLVLFAALPSASSAYILAMRMGGDGAGVAWLISATTLLAVPSLTFWLHLL
ncbi:AEC family transporter [Aromatoleum toluclasticum]|uniref:AEC family transporter n=1 Tax=Aromatoleum toluclasticum TaxID=92003 RepID=UPI000376C949|nr:AEC family transporter [Aromatoleum toluclasticum]MCC4115587.1 AEC family transporter [Aromatoleum toluclasticum]